MYLPGRIPAALCSMVENLSGIGIFFSKNNLIVVSLQARLHQLNVTGLQLSRLVPDTAVIRLPVFRPSKKAFFAMDRTMLCLIGPVLGTEFDDHPVLRPSWVSNSTAFSAVWAG